MIYREHQRGLYASERPGVNLRNLTPGRSSYPVIVTGKDAPTAKHCDA
jgi:hypothetical protein